MNTDKTCESDYLILRMSLQQQTEHIRSSISNGFCYEGEFYGAYELRQKRQLTPLLIVEGLNNEKDSLGNTHLQVTTIPKAQVGGQHCTPFKGSTISSLFRNFVGYKNSKLDFHMPEVIEEGNYKNVYIPKEKSDLMIVDKHILRQRGVRYLRWGLSGNLVLDRSGRGYNVEEPVMSFDPEVIVDTGED